MAVTVKDGKLELAYKGYVTPLEHWHYETFRTTATDLADEKLTFGTDSRGRVITVSAALETAVKDIVFKRKPPVS
jgi:hypothetical protein